MDEQKKQANINKLKAMRKMVQMSMASMPEMDADDVAEIAAFVDPWVSGGKYKKGYLAAYGNAVYRCTANVNKSEATPDQDSGHWQRADMADDGVEVWTEPTGKGYQKGDRVHYPTAEDPVYVSQKNNNTVTPGTDEKYWVAE